MTIFLTVIITTVIVSLIAAVCWLLKELDRMTAYTEEYEDTAVVSPLAVEQTVLPETCEEPDIDYAYQWAQEVCYRIQELRGIEFKMGWTPEECYANHRRVEEQVAVKNPHLTGYEFERVVNMAVEAELWAAAPLGKDATALLVCSFRGCENEPRHLTKADEWLCENHFNQYNTVNVPSPWVNIVPNWDGVPIGHDDAYMRMIHGDPETPGSRS